MRQSADQRARAMGFNSAEQLARVVEIGAHLRGGGQLTNAHVAQLAQAYPALPRSEIQRRAVEINQQPAAQRFNTFATEVGGADSVLEAARLVDSYSTHYERESTVDQLSDRLDARGNPNKAQVQRPKEDPSSLRSVLSAKLLQAANAQSPATKGELRQNILQRAEHAQDVFDKPGEYSLRDTLGAAMDGPEIDHVVEHFELDQPDTAEQGAA